MNVRSPIRQVIFFMTDFNPCNGSRTIKVCHQSLVRITRGRGVSIPIQWNLLYTLSCCFRNLDHHSRPSFSELCSSLKDDSDRGGSSLLDAPVQALQAVRDPARAAQLGAPLSCAQDLYRDLQQYYYWVYSFYIATLHWAYINQYLCQLRPYYAGNKAD